MPTDRRRRKEDAGIFPFKDPAFRRASVYFDDIEYQRRFEQNLIRYGILSKAQITKEITTAAGGGGGGGGGWCYWTKEGSNLVYYGGNVGIGVHPHDNDFEVRGNVLVEAVAEQPYVEIRNWSDTAYDPVIHWSLGATSVKKYTMGVDDSDSDAWLLCSGDILTSTVEASTSTMARNFDGFLFVLDTLNDRLKKHLSADAMTYVSKIGSTGTGDDNFATPQAICNDGTYLYICDRANHRIVKRKASDLSYIAETGSLGSGVDDFNNPWGICTDGTHIYITDSGNNRIKKHLCADLSYVALATVSSSDPLDPHNFNSPRAICTDGTYLYITQNGGIVARLVILFCSTLSDVLHIHDDGHIDSCELIGICVTGGYLYILNQNDPGTLKHVYKYNASSLSYVTHWGVYGTGVGQMTQALAIDTDGTTLWIFDYATIPDANRLMKFLLDGTYVATYGSYGSGDTQFYYACGLSLSGKISGVTTTPYRAPILKAGLDGNYCDSYPLFRARDGFQLMEDGTVAATKYVGLYAPAAITASYSLTFPGTGPAAAGHFAVDAAGLITWGQDLIVTASPTFAGLTLSGLTASHPVFTDASSALVSTGTVPVDHGGTGIAVYAIGDLIYASGTTTLALLADVAVASYLRSGGVGAAPLWSTLKLPDSATAFRLPVATSANTIGEVAAVGAAGEYLAGATAAIPAWATLNQAAVAGLTTADSPNFAGLSVGTNDLVRGLLYLYGHDTGGVFGGTLLCYTSADHDTVIGNYGFMVKEDDLLIGPDTNVDALLLDSNDDLYVTAGSIILPASEYLNFGGVLGAGSYGMRDNAGTIELKNSGGAWASPLSSVTAHNILSATHGDSLADTVVLGDIMHGNVTPKWARLAGNATAVKQYLSQTGTGAVSAAPAWAAIAQADVAGLTTGDSPTFAGLTLTADLTVPNGGTGASTFTDHGVLYGQAAVAIGATAEGATGQYLAGATGAAPGWATLNQAAVAGLTTADGPTFDHVHITTGPVALADGDVTVASGHGVDFSAAHSANSYTSLLLDAYEEGAWTPAIMFGGATAGVTYGAENAGYYTRTGRTVTATAWLQLTSKGSSVGAALITGLPFTPIGTRSGGGIGLIYKITYTGMIMVMLIPTNSYYYLMQTIETGTQSQLTDANFSDDSEISITVTYLI